MTAVDKTDVLPEPTTRSAGAWAVPWTLLALIVLTVVAWRVVRRRRRKAQAKPVGGSGGGGNGDGGAPRPPAPDNDGDGAAVTDGEGIVVEAVSG